MGSLLDGADLLTQIEAKLIVREERLSKMKVDDGKESLRNLQVIDIMGILRESLYVWRGDGTDELGEIKKAIVIDEEGLMGLVLHGEDTRRALWRR